MRARSYGQASYIGKASEIQDTLLIKLDYQVYDGVMKDYLDNEILPDLVYNFKEQYPYYSVFPNKWRVGEKVHISLKKVPRAGYLYLFRLDGNNTPILLKDLKLDTLNEVNSILAYSGVYTLSYKGREYIGIWYSKAALPRSNELIEGIEMTLGNIIKRNIQQLGRKLMLPHSNWHLTGREFGFVLTQSQNVSKESNGVLPVIIELGSVF